MNNYILSILADIAPTSRWCYIGDGVCVVGGKFSYFYNKSDFISLRVYLSGKVEHSNHTESFDFNNHNSVRNALEKIIRE